MPQEPLSFEAEALPLWSAVDAYIESLLLPQDAALTAALADSEAAGLPAIQVAPRDGALLSILARATRARRILEIGTLGGYSTIWLARALPPGGRLISLELEPRHAEVARANIERAGLAERVEVRLAPAIDSLAQLAAEGAVPFDFIFIDADKGGYAEYLGWAVRLARPGALIVSDNVVRHGRIVEPSSYDEQAAHEAGGEPDPNVVGIRRFLEAAAAEPHLSTTVLQTVGSKGWDGLAVSVVGA